MTKPLLHKDIEELREALNPFNQPDTKAYLEESLKQGPKPARDKIERIEFDAIGYEKRNGKWIDRGTGKEANSATISKVMGDVDRLMLVDGRNPLNDRLRKMFEEER